MIPLACGGADAALNLQWLPTAMWREEVEEVKVGAADLPEPGAGGDGVLRPVIAGVRQVRLVAVMADCAYN